MTLMESETVPLVMSKLRMLEVIELVADPEILSVLGSVKSAKYIRTSLKAIISLTFFWASSSGSVTTEVCGF